MRLALGRPRSHRRAATAAIAWVVLLTALALPMSPATAVPDETIADDFDSYSFSGSTGSLAWDGPWLEVGESDGVGAGTIQVGDEPNCLNEPCLVVGLSSGPDAWVERVVDLSGYASATLTFDYKVHRHPPGGGVGELSVSDDGGGSWVTLDTWPLGTTTADLVGSYDLTPYLAPDTVIRFGATDSSSDSHFNVDNLVITASGRQGYFDEFMNLGWDGSDGSLDWTPDPWQESEGDGAMSGLIQAIGSSHCASGNCLRIEGSATSGAHNVLREVDLDGVTFASLLFNYRRDSYNTCSIRLEVSDNGGSSWNHITTYPANGGDATQQSAAHDITAYAAPDTQIRFISDGTCTAGEFFYADNIWVFAGTDAGSNQPPGFDQDLLDRSDNAGTLVTIAAPATDPDVGDTVTYTATGLPEGIAIDPGTGNISGMLGVNSPGTYSVTITATDDGTPALSDTDTFTWTVTAGEAFYLVAGSGGGAGGDDLLTGFDPDDFDDSTNEADIGNGLGTYAAEGADIDPDTGILYAGADDEIGTVDPATGLFTARPSRLGSGDGPQGHVTFDGINALAFHPSSGELFVVIGRITEEDLLIKADPATGAHIPGAFGGDDYVPIEGLSFDRKWNTGIDFDPTTEILYGVTNNLVATTLITIDPTSGQSTEIGSTRYGTGGLAFDGAGQLWGVRSQFTTHDVFEIDKATGTDANPRPIDNGSQYRAMAIGGTPPPNNAPAFDQDLPDRSDPEGTVVSLAAGATDPDLDDITYAATGLPGDLSIDPSTGLVSGTINFAAAGTYPVEITVTDDGVPNLAATDTFTWTVTELNLPPAFDQDLPDRTDAEGTAISLSASATDPDAGDVVTYGANGLPPGLVLDTVSGEISGTIDYTAATGSPYAVTITAADDRIPPGTATPDTFTWTVTNTNQPPVVVNPGPQTVPELTPFSTDVTASDPDGTIPSLTDSGTLPAWATLTDNLDGTATISGAPGIGDSGTTTVTITASDGSLTDNAIFDITVTNTNVAPTIANPGNQTGSEGNPFSVTVTAGDPDGTTVGFGDSGTLPAWATLTDNGDDTATILGTPGYDDAGTTTVTITASDGSLTDDAVFDIIIANTNRPPVVAPIADELTAENVALTAIAVSATDPDGTAPSLSAPSLPGWATLIDNGDGTGTITGTPGYDDAATTTVTVLAFDGSLLGTTEFDLTVTNTNRAPVLGAIGDRFVAEGAALAPVSATATDPDGTAPSLAAFGLPAWATFVDNGDGTGTITGTPGYDDAGVSTVSIYAEDGGTPNLSDTVAFDITVTNTNRPPVLGAIADQVVAEATALPPLTITATDPDGTTPSLSAAGLPGWASFVDNGDGSATVTGLPATSDAGVSTVTVTATDTVLSDVKTFDITVTESNLRPVFDNTLPNRSDAEGAAVLIDAGATDPNGDAMTYSAAGLPPGTTLNIFTGQISGTIAYDAAGVYSVTVTAADDGIPVLKATETFTWTITNTNRRPALMPIAAVLGPELSPVSFTAAATDPDGDAITYTIAGGPPGAAINPATGAFTWTPGEVHGPGSYPVTVIATDAGTPARTDTKIVTITVTEVNHAPTIERIGDQHNDEGDAVNLGVVAIDPDIPLNSLSFRASGLPAGLAIDPATGFISGTVSSGAGGTHLVTVTATDDGSPQQEAAILFKWMIGDTNHPPEMDPIADRTVSEHTRVSFQPSASDPDGDSITFVVAGAPPGASFDSSTGAFRWVPNEEQGPGVYRISIIAEDSGAPELVSIRVVTITVTETNEAPVIAALPDRIDDATTAVSVPVTATDPDLPANSISYAATGLPTGLSIDPETGLITGKIDAAAEPGVTRHEVVITAGDDGVPALEATAGFAWTVVTPEVIPENFPPSVTPITGQYTDAGTMVALQVEATDEEPLEFTATGLPPGLAIDSTTGLITGAVGDNAVGTHAVTIIVSEVGDSPLHTSVAFPWTVTDREAAQQKEEVVVTMVAPDPASPTDEADATADSRPLRRGLVVMSSAAAATTESLRLPFLLLLALMAGFATVGRIGLYPLLWRGDRHTGTISFYDPEVNFGLIQPDAGGEAVFVHAHAFPRRQRGLLAAGVRLRYRVLAGDNRSSAWGAALEVGNE